MRSAKLYRMILSIMIVSKSIMKVPMNCFRSESLIRAIHSLQTSATICPKLEIDIECTTVCDNYGL